MDAVECTGKQDCPVCEATIGQHRFSGEWTEGAEGTFEDATIWDMYPDGLATADPDVLDLTVGASTHTGGGASPVCRITRTK